MQSAGCTSIYILADRMESETLAREKRHQTDVLDPIYAAGDTRHSYDKRVLGIGRRRRWW